MKIARAIATRAKKVPSQKPGDLGVDDLNSRKAAPELETNPIDTTPQGN